MHARSHVRTSKQVETHTRTYLIDGVMRFYVVGGDDVVAFDGDVAVFRNGVHGPEQLRYEFEAGQPDAADEGGAPPHRDRTARRYAIRPSRHEQRSVDDVSASAFGEGERRAGGVWCAGVGVIVLMIQNDSTKDF